MQRRRLPIVRQGHRLALLVAPAAEKIRKK
jgi:hypothetical protein